MVNTGLHTILKYYNIWLIQMVPTDTNEKPQRRKETNKISVMATVRLLVGGADQAACQSKNVRIEASACS